MHTTGCLEMNAKVLKLRTTLLGLTQHTRTNTHTYTQHTHNTHTDTHNTQTHTYTHIHTHTQTHTHTTHTQHTHRHTQHTDTHIHTHTHTHTHTVYSATSSFYQSTIAFASVQTVSLYLRGSCNKWRNGLGFKQMMVIPWPHSSRNVIVYLFTICLL